MSNKAKTYVAPNRNGWNGSGATPKCPPESGEQLTCPVCIASILQWHLTGHRRIGNTLRVVHEGCVG